MTSREEFRNVDLFSLQCPPCLGHDIQAMFTEIDRLRADLAVMTQGVMDAAEDRDTAQEQLAAVHAALDQYEEDKDGDWFAVAYRCVATIAKVVGR